MSYELLYPILRKSGSKLRVEEFHENINIIFHNHEAKLYDKLHSDMWGSLQEQIDLLIGDLTKVRTLERNLKILDIGMWNRFKYTTFITIRFKQAYRRNSPFGYISRNAQASIRESKILGQKGKMS
jgi:hypothetical protein